MNKIDLHPIVIFTFSIQLTFGVEMLVIGLIFSP